MQAQAAQQTAELESEVKASQQKPEQVEQAGLSKLKSKWWLWLIIVIAVIGLGAGLYFWLVP
jgi:uncharacterized protein HemX